MLREGEKIRDIIPGRKRFENYWRFGLNLTTLYPELEDKIGIYWYSDIDITICTKTFSNIFGFRNRSINCFHLYKCLLIEVCPRIKTR